MSNDEQTTCALCPREGQLVCQTVEPPPANSDPARFPGDPTGPWVFRYYLCRWHRGARNRTRLDRQRKAAVVEYVDDATLIANSTSPAKESDQ